MAVIKRLASPRGAGQPKFLQIMPRSHNPVPAIKYLFSFVEIRRGSALGSQEQPGTSNTNQLGLYRLRPKLASTRSVKSDQGLDIREGAMKVINSHIPTSSAYHSP